MGSRRQSREAAMKFLYQQDANVESVTSSPERFARHFGVSPEHFEFFKILIDGVGSHLAELDALLESTAENWKLYRMARVDRSILRMATWELKAFPSTDYQVVLDEAIELAKIYGSSESSSFVNGILDKIARQMRGDQSAAVA